MHRHRLLPGAGLEAWPRTKCYADTNRAHDAPRPCAGDPPVLRGIGARGRCTALVQIDVSRVATGEQLDGNIQARLREAGFEQQLTGEHRPPVSRYVLGDDAPGGFYAEFLTPLIGREFTKGGELLATMEKAGVTAQRLRYLELLLQSPWTVTLDAAWGVAPPLELRIPNPVSFIVQKLLIHDDRAHGKSAQDLLYIHDTIELFAPELDELALIWREQVRHAMHEKWVRKLGQTIETVFGTLNDRIRDAAAIPQDRDLDPERMRSMCHAALGEMLEWA